MVLHLFALKPAMLWTRLAHLPLAQILASDERAVHGLDKWN